MMPSNRQQLRSGRIAKDIDIEGVLKFLKLGLREKAGAVALVTCVWLPIQGEHFPRSD